MSRHALRGRGSGIGDEPAVQGLVSRLMVRGVSDSSFLVLPLVLFFLESAAIQRSGSQQTNSGPQLSVCRALRRKLLVPLELSVELRVLGGCQRD